MAPDAVGKCCHLSLLTNTACCLFLFLQLPWAADKAIQQLGRSHRSGQETSPIYKMVVTELGGEWRFASAVSKRMAHLGALTKGDRRAATGTDLHRFDIDSIFGGT